MDCILYAGIWRDSKYNGFVCHTYRLLSTTVFWNPLIICLAGRRSDLGVRKVRGHLALRQGTSPLHPHLWVDVSNTNTRNLLHFHAIARWVVGVYEHGDWLSRVLFWRKLEMVTVESDDLPCPRVRPLRRDYPPGTQAACFHLYFGDWGLNLSTEPAASPGENDQNDHKQHYKTNDDWDHQWKIHVPSPPERNSFIRPMPVQAYRRLARNAMKSA